MSGNQLDLPLGVPQANASWDRSVLENVSEINDQLLSYLAQQAGIAELSRQWPLLDELREQWADLSEGARGRLADCPYLLIDGGFAQALNWSAARVPGVQDGPDAAAPRIFRDDAVPLIRRMLLLAWHLARSNRIAARMVLGMSQECAERLASYRLQELELLAELRPEWIRPRWSERLGVWRQLLLAAGGAVPGELRRAQLRGVQLLAASLIAPGSDALAGQRLRRG